jgi:microcystin-dependent protein
MPFWGWSKTAASNANSDPTINWAEGMAPSAVNDSARAMTARLAEWRDDISGTITTGGTGTAYTIASNQVFDTLAHMNGAMIAFVPHTTCGANVTLNVDGLGAKPLRTSPGVELQTGMLIQGTPYVATYINSDGAFYLQNVFSNPFNIPVGGLMPYLGSSAPNANFALPFGQAISRTTYSALFSLVSTTFGTGDGSTTFNIPDLRGRAVFGLDNMGGSSASRITVAGGNFDGTVRGGTGGAENHMLTTAEMPVHNHGITDPGHSHATAIFKDQLTNGAGSNAYGATAGGVPTTTNTTGITINNAGSGGLHTILSPAMTLAYILRVA